MALLSNNKTKNRATGRRYDNVTFVKAWLSSSSVDEVAEKMEATKAAMSAKANNLRAKGVKLPKMVNRNAPDSVEQLNKLIKKLGG